MRLFSFVLAACWTIFWVPFAAASIQIDASILASNAADGDLTRSAGGDITMPPYSPVNAIAGDSFANMDVSWTIADGQTAFSYSLNHHRAAGAISSAGSTQPVLLFTAADDEPFAIFGFYNVTNFSSDETGRSLFQAVLFDSSASVTLSLTQSSSTTNAEHQILTTTGNLTAGHHYQLAFEALIATIDDNVDAGANGIGQITLAIGANAAVPEPTSVFIWGGMIAIIGAAVFSR